MKIRLNKVLVLVLVLAMMATTVYAMPNFDRGNGPENAPGFKKNIGEFNDLGEFVWAQRYIERMAKKDVIKGVGNGAFMPSNTAKEIETIIMLIRFIDPDFEENYDEDIELPEEYNGKKPSDWMVPYIEKAYDLGLITEDDMDTFDPNFPTKRSKAAVYFVRAADILDDSLDLVEEAEDNMETILPYNDYNSIPKEHIGYVYVADALGLIEGYPNGTFQGNKSINRAELAAMMDRLDGEYESDYSYRLVGKIVDLDIDDMEIDLQIAGNVKTFVISNDVDVYIDGDEANLEDLAVNMVVKVYVYNGEIIDISFRSDDEDEVVIMRYEGEILDFDDNYEEITIQDEEELTFSVTSDTTIHVPVLDDELIEEFVGLDAVVKAENTTATSITIKLNQVEGILIGINTSGEAIQSVDVKLDESTTDTFVFFEDFEICIDEEPGELNDEYLGHVVKMKLLGNDEVVTLCVITEVYLDDLEALVVDAETLVEDNYTTESWITFETALTEAGIVLDETYPTQDEVDTAYDNLKGSMDSLIPTVRDLIVTDSAIVTGLDNENTELTVAFGTTVGALEFALESDFYVGIQVLDTSGGYEVSAGEDVTADMVLELTPQYGATVEYTIIVESE